ncbi:hypothetical protein MACJ_003841 [Theileria orientalis]|uniref:Co-chaperone HscB C-terminal oligomerisation domain-containing protein n=1 Tax=Theileria orientalis TaxID=68886 RepID=A0A976XJZ9_THEOR|nr:hypothetical protein MACJ_003841 [Theileria orientalis]
MKESWDFSATREEYNIDKNLLSQKHKQYQFMLHPDKHANKSSAELDLITSNSSLVNTFYNTLLDDKERAKCLFVMKYGKELFEKMISKEGEDQLEEIMEAHEKVELLRSEEERKEMKTEFKKKIEDAVNKIGTSFKNEVNIKTNKRVQEPNSIIDNYRHLSFYRQIYEKLK